MKSRKMSKTIREVPRGKFPIYKELKSSRLAVGNKTLRKGTKKQTFLTHVESKIQKTPY